jgi:hypothetical protein
MIEKGQEGNYDFKVTFAILDIYYSQTLTGKCMQGNVNCAFYTSLRTSCAVNFLFAK